MPRRFETAIVLPDYAPAGPAYAVHRQYVDDQRAAAITAAANAAAANQFPRLVPTTKTASTGVVSGDFVLADASAGPITITLPVASGLAVVAVKKVDATANIVTIATSGGNTVGSMGAATIPIRLTDQAAVFQANGTNWLIGWGYQSLTSLDARYAMSASPTFTGVVTVPEPTTSTGAASKNYVDTTTVPATQRGPLGGVGAYTLGASTFTLNPSFQHLRYTLTGDVTVNLPATAPADGQRVLIEALASGANRTITFATGFEISAAVPGRAVTIPSGTWAYIALLYRNGAMRIVSVDPVVPAASQAITYAATITPDASLGSQFHCMATGNVSIAPPTNPIDGQRLMVEVMAIGATRTATLLASSSTSNASGATLPFSIAVGKVAYFGFVYSGRAAHWILVAATNEP